MKPSQANIQTAEYQLLVWYAFLSLLLRIRLVFFFTPYLSWIISLTQAVV
uniref:Uncharacterized protein n=1 Tax=Arundo donax TaxID=35708 RepID=A0A0A9AXW1_ARUDO